MPYTMPHICDLHCDIILGYTLAGYIELKHSYRARLFSIAEQVVLFHEIIRHDAIKGLNVAGSFL